MLFVSAALYLVIVYVRPGEIVPGLAGVPLLPAAAVLCLVAATLSLLLRPRPIVNGALDFCLLGYWVAIVLSNPVNGWFGGALEGFNEFRPVVVCYFAIKLAIEEPKHLRWFVGLLVLLSVFQATNGIVQCHTGVGLGSVTALEVRAIDASDEVAVARAARAAEEARSDIRVRGTGIFNDPNDLAMALVMAVPFLLSSMARKGTGFLRRGASGLAFTVILLAIYYTNSRGGILGLGAAIGTHAWYRFGRGTALAIMVCGLGLLLVAGPSRVGHISSGEASAQGRIQAWAAGLQMFRTNPAIGAGYTRYDEFHERAAHNSFVHVLGELGLVGAGLFVGMFYWYFRCLLLLKKAARDDLTAALIASGAGVVACIMFLSRQYTIVVFVLLALGAGRHNLAATGEVGPATGADWVRIGAITMAGVVVAYIAVRTLAVWSFM